MIANFETERRPGQFIVKLMPGREVDLGPQTSLDRLDEYQKLTLKALSTEEGWQKMLAEENHDVVLREGTGADSWHAWGDLHVKGASEDKPLGESATYVLHYLQL